MKDKIKSFLKEKKELLVFLGVLIFTFVSVFTIAYNAMKDTKNTASIPENPTVEPGNKTPTMPPVTGGGTGQIEPMAHIGLPVAGSYIITRQYFDVTNTEIELEKAVISNGYSYIPSRGISYAKESNESFAVLAIYDGVVKEISGDSESLDGYTVTIDHNNGMVSVYHSLDDISIKKGDSVKCGQSIGVSGTSVSDLGALVHVHLEVLIDGKYINPTNAIGKELTDVVSSMK